MSFPIAQNDAARLQALYDLNILDTPREPCYDAVVEMARAYFDVPICIVSLVDRDRQWFKAACGLGVDETSREVAFCNYRAPRKIASFAKLCESEVRRQDSRM